MTANFLARRASQPGGPMVQTFPHELRPLLRCLGIRIRDAAGRKDLIRSNSRPHLGRRLPPTLTPRTANPMRPRGILPNNPAIPSDTLKIRPPVACTRADAPPDAARTGYCPDRPRPRP